MYILFLVLLLAINIVLAVLNVRFINKMKETVISEDIRVKSYKQGIIEGWIPVLFVLLLCIFSSISIHDIGLRQLNFEYNLWFNIVILAICGGFFVLLLYQMISYMVSAKYREQANTQFLKNVPKNHYNAVMNNIAIPHSKKEKRLFIYLSLTAGIGEEIVLRGFLYFILSTIFPSFSQIIILVIASVIFGLLHLYQGIIGVIKTTLFGALFGCLYLVTGSIFPGILLHFIADSSSSFILSEE